MPRSQRVVGVCWAAASLTLTPSWVAEASGQSAPLLDQSVLAPDEPQRALKEGKTTRAIRVATPSLLDGRLDDQVWRLATPLTDLIQRDPDNGQPMSQPSVVQFAYDDRFLYVAFMNVDRDAAAIASGLARRDEPPQTDQVTIGIDPRHDHQTGYFFQTNPSGWQGDLSLFDDDRTERDYNAVWDVRTQILDTGWSAEFRIPFSQLRFTASPSPGQVWGLNVQRQIRRRSENGTWVPKPRGTRGEVSLFGHLVFEAPIEPPSRLELTPYALARTEQRTTGRENHGGAAGLDVRAGLGNAATLSATLNPDFGQVEQDPAVLNLSIFESFFPERRPFFLEDSRTFVPPYGLFQLFHSRRIGRAPGRLAIESGDTLVSRPAETTILGASKLTGKSGKWTYGALTAVTGREYADVETPIAGSAGVQARAERLIEPATSYNVVRAQRDVRGGSNVGVIATGVLRERSQDAVTGGFDYNIRWDQNRTRFDGHWVATRAPGAGGVKTSGGGVTNFNVSRKHWNVGVHADHFGRDFRVNDIGFFRSRTNRNDVNASVEVGQPDPGKRLRRLFVGAYVDQAWNDEHLVFERSAQMFVSTQLLNFWNVNGGVGGNFETMDDLDSRGGPPIVRPSSRYVYFNVNSDSRKRWRLNVGGDGGTSASGAWGGSAFVGLSMQASVSGNYSAGEDAAQWITNVDATGDGVTDYVYGRLRRNVVNLTLRGTYAFTRDLTLQGYLQPFVAVGDYDQVRRLARPRSYEFDPATISFDPDFNNKSLRGNAVLRWEYVRGSTFFLVWDLSQADASRPGAFSPLRDLRTAFGANANHVIIAKVSYWLNR